MLITVFTKILNMSINASLLVLAVILLRLLLNKAPKNIRCIIWALVGFRLVCPFSIESILSLIPSKEVVPSEINNIHGIELIDRTVLNIVSNPVYSDTVTYEMQNTVSSTQVKIMYASAVWAIGIIAMILYAIISYIRLYLKVREAIPYKDNIRLCDRVSTPFILGIFKPKIYLPSDINEADSVYVIGHEKAHLKRLDHVWKPLGFMILAVHWFNPLIWLAYILFCRDIELACDEKVIKTMGTDSRKAYSNALINCSAPKFTVTACPLAFGETGIKDRIKKVLNYKKPAFWLIVISVIACIAVAVCFLTDPVDKDGAPDSEVYNINVTGSGVVNSNTQQIYGRVTDADLVSESPYIEIEWVNNTQEEIILGSEFYIYRIVDNTETDIRKLPDGADYVWNSLAHILPAGGSCPITYHLNYMDIDSPDTYFLKTGDYIVGESGEKYALWLEFQVGATEFFYNDQYFKAVELIYDDAVYSYYQTAENAPEYQIVGASLYMRETENDKWTDLGTLQEITLDKENFDSRFSDFSWSGNSSAEKLRNGNAHAWQLKVTRNDINELYLILKQNNGDYYVGCGYFDQGKVSPKNDDDSSIRWLYKVEQIAEEATQAITPAGT